MRILIIHNKYKQAGGEDSVFRAECMLLVQHGHTVQQILYDNVMIKTLYDKFMSGLKSIYNPDSARDIRAKILEFKPDVIHVHNFFPLISPSVFYVADQLAIPVVVTLHNYRLICPSATLFHNGQVYEQSIHSIFPWNAIWKGVYRNSMLQTAVVVLMTAIHHLMGTWKNKVGTYIALTQFAKEKFEDSVLSIPSGQIVVKPNFVEDGGPVDHKREDFFLYVGRLTEEKGIRILMSAAKLRLFSLIVIGDGPLRSLVEDDSFQNPHISYLGYQSTVAVMSYMKRCKALIFPSIWYEGFPVTIVEAFAAGTPVIASNMGGMNEIIVDRINGLLFDPGNVHDLIHAIDELSNEETMTRSISENARSYYLKYYTPEINYGRLANIYEDVIKRIKHRSTDIGISHPAYN